ncbi:hypothetical protein UA08_01741 [Talaromyces atroroseus]|uniref:M protein repeat protein n=1 Tax=Talaromyces atroroseus TaxID=1441469 RepID=A0A1Q5QAU2_TALAT|nr:hypothetical protein UA08_01741 [Talaromyces atroroseus]OKL62889.1 hypothetical protein UA08_01741 [Talaromyces atroroseus]
MADDEERAKAEKLAAARKRVAQMQKQKGKKNAKKAAAEEPSKDETIEKPSSVEPAAETPDAVVATDEQQAKGEEQSPAEPMPDAPSSPGPETSPTEVKELPTREAHARQPSLSLQSKIRSSSFRNSISSAVSPGSGIKSPPLPPLAPDDEQIHEVFRKQAARLEDLEKENKRLEKEFNNANARRQKAEDQLDELRESSVEVIELKDRLAKAEEQVAELERLKAEIASLQRQNSLLQSKTHKASASVAGHSDSPPSELVQQLESKTSTIEAMEIEISNLRAQLSSESTSNDAYKNQITALEEKLSQNESTLQKTQGELNDVRQSLSRASEKALKEGVDKTSTETLIKGLQREIEELKDAKSSAEKKGDALDKKLQALAHLHKESESRHQSRLKDHEKVEKEVALLKKKLALVENENLRLREEKDRVKKRDSEVENNEGLDELEDEERSRLERRVRELEGEVFDLRRGVWKERRKELGAGTEDENDGVETAPSPAAAFDEVDLIGGAPGHSRRRSLMAQNRQQQQHSSFSTVLSSGLAAFTGGSSGWERRVPTQNHPPAARGSLELLAEEDNDEFDEEAFARAQAEEEARKRVEWAREVKRKLRDWKGWRLDLVDSRAGAEGAGVAMGEIFEV